MALASAIVVDHVETRLKTVVFTGGPAGRTFVDRGHPLEEADLPAWRITAPSEQINPDDEETMHYPSIQLHELEIEATAVLRSVAAGKADMRTVELQALQALFGAAPPYGLRCQSIERAAGTEGECAVHNVRLRLLASFSTAQNAPETIL
jgi:hypothetical protein